MLKLVQVTGLLACLGLTEDIQTQGSRVSNHHKHPQNKGHEEGFWHIMRRHSGKHQILPLSERNLGENYV